MSSISRIVAFGMVASAGLALLAPGSGQSADPAPLTGSALRNECVKAGTAMPDVKRAIMINRGYKDDQYIYLRTHQAPVPSECDGAFRRIIEVQVKLKPGKGRAVTLADQKLYVGNEGGMGVLSKGPGGHNGWPDKQLYRCTPGPGKTEVYGLINREVIVVSSGRVARLKTSRVPLKVEAPC